jgi:hypothetical protein
MINFLANAAEITCRVMSSNWKLGLLANRELRMRLRITDDSSLSSIPGSSIDSLKHTATAPFVAAFFAGTNPAQAERALIAILVNPAQLRGNILGRPFPGL